jgi:hypothetical protein
MSGTDVQKTGFFEEKPGVKSSTRFIYIIGMLWMLMASSFFAYRGQSPMEVSAFVAAVAVVFGGLKIANGALNENKPEQK